MDGLGGNGVGHHPVLPQIAITGLSNRDVIPRVEVGFLFEQRLEREAALLKKLQVRFAVLYELFLEVKLYIFSNCSAYHFSNCVRPGTDMDSGM